MIMTDMTKLCEIFHCLTLIFLLHINAGSLFDGIRVSETVGTRKRIGNERILIF